MTRQTPNIRRMVVAAMIARGLLRRQPPAAAALLRGGAGARLGGVTLLPYWSPDAIVGVTLGCALTNALGSSMGLIDVVVGTSATLIAALMSWALRKARVFGLPVASSLPPVLVNAVFIGAEITLLSPEGWNTGVFLATALSVGAGQLLSCCVLGLLLVWALERKGLGERLFGKS